MCFLVHVLISHHWLVHYGGHDMLCGSDQYLIRQNVNLLMPEALSLTFKHQPRVHYCSL